MRVLFVAPYIYNSNVKAFRKNKTGFGILLDQMTEYIGEKCELYVFTNIITPEMQHNNAKMVKHTWLTVFANASWHDIVCGVRSALHSKQSLRDRLLYIYYRMNCGALRKTIDLIHPDVIHCHGVGEKLLYYFDTCKASGVPVVNTMHGLIGLSNSIVAYKENKASEIEYLQRAEREHIPTTVVSTGILQRIKSEYSIKDTSFLSVITNGVNIEKTDTLIDVRARHRIAAEQKIIVAVGSVGKNKNQIQTVRSFSLLPNDIKSRYTVLLLGTIAEGYAIHEEIARFGLSDKVICCGFIDNREVACYYQAANLNILASIDEGFGLSMVEGFIYGLPCVTFSDLDAIPDIYNDRAMVLCAERTDEAFAQAIMNALNKQWDSTWICEYGKRFSLVGMAERYTQLYRKVVDEYER